MRTLTTRVGLAVSALLLSLAGLGLSASPASAMPSPQDTSCMRAGMATLKRAGLFATVAREGLPISVALSLGVTPRAGTDVASVPDPIPLSLLLADHRAGDHSLFIYPWC